jgi:hypothetical protein
MSTTHDHGNIVFQCDGDRCRETLETNTSNFEAARNLLRRAAWRPYKPAGAPEWLHQCRGCARQAGAIR